MAHTPAERAGFLQQPSTAVLSGLVAIHLLVLVVIVARASSLAPGDADVARANRIATSPAIAYRNFPVEYMPLQTLFDRTLADGDIAAAGVRIAMVAFLADMAAAVAMAWGWGRRHAVTYLLLGFPLLSFLYLRFDLVAVALTAWSLALLHRRREELGGAALGLAVMAKLWPLVVLVPIFVFRKARRALVVGVVVCLAIGAWWYLTGGPKAPFQVVSFRGTRGWHVESVVGSVLWALGRGVPYREADAIRIGHAALAAKALLFLGLLAVEGLIWRRASRDGRDPAGAAALASVAALAVFSPLFSLQMAAWLLPFAALALDGDHDERHTAGVATVAVILTGLVALVWRDQTSTPASWVAWLVVARNLVWIDIVVSWLRIKPLPVPTDPAEVPRRRAADAATEGLETVLPFDAE
ncbi:MAG: glycosyltransferase family 87 protein [Actinomycetota bacterium]